MLHYIISLFEREKSTQCKIIFFLVEKMTDRDKFMSAEEAKNFGLIDRVLSHQQIEVSEGEGENSNTKDDTAHS